MRPQAGWGTVAELMDPKYQAAAFFGGPNGPNYPSPRGLLDIPGWQREYNELKAQTAAEYEELKAARSEVRELQQIRRSIDAAERCEQQEQAPSLQNQKKQNMEL